MQGHRPLVEIDSARVGYCDTALTEVIKRKLTYEMVTEPEAVLPAIGKIAAFTPKSLAV